MANVVVSLYYYLLVLKAAYLDEPIDVRPPIQLGLTGRGVAVAMILLIVGLGFYPAPLLDMVQAAVANLP